MASQYFAILTDYGTTAFANALSSKQPLQLTTFAVGDGNGQAVTPTANRTVLAREKHRAPVSAVSLDPRNKKQVIVELTIPENVGGFYIREMGVFDNQNKLVAYANCPESFKPTESSGSGKVQVLRMILKVSSSSAVTLSVDHSVIFVTRQQLTPKTITAETQNSFDEDGHSHEIDQATTSKAGIVRLNSTINSTSETEAATPKAVKTLKDLLDSVSRNQANYIPNSKKSSSLSSPSSDTVATSAAVKTAYEKGVEGLNAANNANNNANGRVSKSGDTMTGNLTLNHAQPRFHGNRNNSNNWYVGLSDASSNDLKLHSYAHDTSLILQSDKIQVTKPLYVNEDRALLAKDFSQNLSKNGWCKLPNGLILQWGVLTAKYEYTSEINFNIAFPNICFTVLASTSSFTKDIIAPGLHRFGSNGNGLATVLIATAINNTKMRIYIDDNLGENKDNVSWLAIGM